MTYRLVTGFPCILSLILWTSIAGATCDLCSVYSAQQLRTFRDDSVVVGVSEQFTSFEKLQRDGEKIRDDAKQYLKSSITQILARYEFTRDFALQANIPIIARRYRRPDGEGIEKGSESGVGDITMLAVVSPFETHEGGNFFRVNLQGGIKMPTGDSDMLGEEGHSSTTEHGHDDADMADATEPEMEEEMSGHEHEMHMKHGDIHHDEVPNGVHSHSLALGSGSWDFIGGTNFFGQYDRYYAIGSIQYLLRTEGDFDYEFADDLLWELGLGSYLYLDEEGTFSIRANLNGETKGMDRVAGVKQEDTSLTSIFLGPEFVLTLKENFLGSLAFDFPVLYDNSEVGLAPDYRVRIAATYRF